jgi:redox-sensitive bicupin YhaK (pirin superfamily)
MPAISTENILMLKRIRHPEDSAISREVKKIVDAPSGFEGEGFPVKRAFSQLSLESIDPFIMMDQMGEVDYEVGEAKGTPWHPHRGFETVTYLIDGVFKHKDSNGGGGIIGNGDTQWMTAGAGILHIEAPTEEAVLKGGLFHGVQIWVNLPSRLKWANPRYQDIRASSLNLLASHDGSSLIRIIAGNIDGNAGPGITHTPISIVHASVTPGSSIILPWESTFNAIGYILSGNGYAGKEQVQANSGQAIQFGSGDFVNVSASMIQDSRSNNLELLILGGQPIREPIAWQGPFVMNTKDELINAFKDYHSGKMGIIPANNYIPHRHNNKITREE